MYRCQSVWVACKRRWHQGYSTESHWQLPRPCSSRPPLYPPSCEVLPPDEDLHFCTNHQLREKKPSHFYKHGWGSPTNDMVMLSEDSIICHRKCLMQELYNNYIDSVYGGTKCRCRALQVWEEGFGVAFSLEFGGQMMWRLVPSLSCTLFQNHLLRHFLNLCPLTTKYGLRFIVHTRLTFDSNVHRVTSATTRAPYHTLSQVVLWPRTLHRVQVYWPLALSEIGIGIGPGTWGT